MRVLNLSRDNVTVEDFHRLSSWLSYQSSENYGLSMQSEGLRCSISPFELSCLVVVSESC